jgi:hypothetical protein
MNLYTLFGGLVLWIISIAIAGYTGYDYAAAKGEAEAARDVKVAQIASDSAANAAALAISKIRVTNTTVNQEVQREVRTNTVYLDCKHSAEQLQRINEVLTGHRAEAAASGVLPAPDAPD